MLFYTIILVAFGASAVAAVGEVPTASNFEAQFLTLTNSLGVVTGQPTKVTKQPKIYTKQPGVVTENVVSVVPTMAPVPQNTSVTFTKPTISKSRSPIPTGGHGSGTTPPPANGCSQLPIAGVSFLGIGALALAML